ncbi:MAG: GAF domain-containing protein [Candidatus Acidiferrales bacterium]
MAGEFIGELKKWAAELVRHSGEGNDVGLNRAVELISRNFAVRTHEVAIFALTPDDRFLQFLTPDRLREVGQIPTTSTHSLAARTVREKRAEVINHFSVIPHSSVFEAVPISEDQPGEAIQKIMSAPLIVERKVVGVIQISRKANATSDAGPDFTQQQLRELKTIAEALAPCIGAGVKANA